MTFQTLNKAVSHSLTFCFSLSSPVLLSLQFVSLGFKALRSNRVPISLDEPISDSAQAPGAAACASEGHGIPQIPTQHHQGDFAYLFFVIYMGICYVENLLLSS